MLTEAYIEALLVDEELADLVWEAWDAGVITDHLAAMPRQLFSQLVYREVVTARRAIAVVLDDCQIIVGRGERNFRIVLSGPPPAISIPPQNTTAIYSALECPL